MPNYPNLFSVLSFCFFILYSCNVYASPSWDNDDPSDDDVIVYISVEPIPDLIQGPLVGFDIPIYKSLPSINNDEVLVNE